MNCKSTMAPASGLLLALSMSGWNTAYGATPPNACSLLTTKQVSTALGLEVGAGKDSGPLDCQWSQPGKSIGGKGVFLHILGPAGNRTPVERFSTMKTPLPVKGVTKTPVSGVDDDAVYITTSSGPELAVRKGNSVFQIKVNGFSVEESKAKEKELAQHVVAKL
jgi:hypothetical protein